MAKIKDTRRLGLVEITVDDRGRVRLDLFPPGHQPVDLIMPPDDARGLAKGLLEAADAAEQPPGPAADVTCLGGHDGA